MSKQTKDKQEVLKTIFGHAEFRPGQADIIDQLLNGDNVLAVMPTGAGKSLCYQVPALMLERPTVVISPLVALMDNQVAGLRANGVAVSCIHSGQDRDVNVAQWLDVVQGRSKLIYLSPERLMTGRMLSAMRALDPGMFVIDEAHCVSKWGPAFRPEYADLTRLNDMFPDARIAAFTATADAATRTDIADRLFKRKGEVIVHGFDRPNLSLNVTPVANRTSQLLGWMESNVGQAGIVYCLSRKNTEKYAQILKEAGYNALPYHAGLPADVRFENQERFLAEEAVVMVATIAFGMGIDKPDVRFVYHLNLPSSLEAYYQEIGRAGRDGNPAETALLYGMDDIRMRRQFIADEGSEDDHKLREHKRLDALLGYCEAAECRRQVLMSYFGEDTSACGNCDVCENPPELVDATEPAQALFGAILQTGERFGGGHTIAVARGESTDRVVQFGHDGLPAFGAGERWAKTWFQGLLRQATALQFISVDMERYGALSLLPKGRDVLEQGAPFLCKDPTIAKSKSSRQTAARAKRISNAQLNPEDTDLLLRLKALRSELARELGKPAYIVFSDATLLDMVARKPSNRNGMLNVSGVGETKYERFGAAFLAEITG